MTPPEHSPSSRTPRRPRRPRRALRAGAVAALAGLAGLATITAVAPADRDGASGARGHGAGDGPVHVRLVAPRPGDRAGLGSKGWIVDLAVRFPGDLGSTGFTAEQLTGPGAHNTAPPFPGSFSAGPDDRLPGLIVLVSSTLTQRPDGTPTGFSGPGQNLANLFNLTGVTDRSRSSVQIRDTWIVGAPLFGQDTPSTVYVAVAADKDHDGVFDDAPATVPDADGDGRVDASDLRAFGVASNVASARFFIAN